MNEFTIKERILKTLLESPKTTGQIAITLGYIDDKGHGKYNIIKPDLNTLEQNGFIHRIEQKVKRPGAPATTYDIVYEISKLRDLFKKYPILISDLQKNNKVIDSIVADTSSIFDKKYNLNEFLTMFRKMLSLSPSFFENCFTVDMFMFHYYLISEETDQYHLKETECPDFSDIALSAFQHCVINDRLKGVDNEEAIKITHINNISEFSSRKWVLNHPLTATLDAQICQLDRVSRK